MTWVVDPLTKRSPPIVKFPVILPVVAVTTPADTSPVKLPENPPTEVVIPAVYTLPSNVMRLFR